MARPLYLNIDVEYLKKIIYSGELTVRQAAEKYGCSVNTIYDRLQIGSKNKKRKTCHHYARCRCKKCTEKHKLYMRKFRENTKNTEFKHGYSGYTNYGCRCVVCKNGAVIGRKRWYYRAKQD